MISFFTYLNDCNSLWASINPSRSVRAVYNAEEILEIDFPTPTSKNLLHLCSKKVFNCCLSINVTHYRYVSSFSSYYLKCSFFTLSSDVHQYPTRRRNDVSLLHCRTAKCQNCIIFKDTTLPFSLKSVSSLKRLKIELEKLNLNSLQVQVPNDLLSLLLLLFSCIYPQYPHQNYYYCSFYISPTV